MTKDLSFDLLDAIRSPLITHDASWIDCVPKRIRELVTPARMVALRNGEELATLPEAMCYLTTRSFTAPMSHEWSEIFFYVTCTVLEKHFGEDHWNTIGAEKTLSHSNQEELNGLLRHIYNSRRKILKQRIKDGKATVQK